MVAAVGLMAWGQMEGVLVVEVEEPGNLALAHLEQRKVLVAILQ
jgi:hypothetical protein